MLTEDAVIDATRDYLIARDWRVLSQATALQHGDDLVAVKDGVRIAIEAKGAGGINALGFPHDDLLCPA